MPIAYIPSSASPTGADMNRVVAEMDRKMALAFDGLSPLLAAGPFVTNAYGCVAAAGLTGTRYAFTGSETPILYLRGATTYDHARFTAAASAATYVSHDAGTRVMLVHPVTVSPDGGAFGVFDLDWSLEAHRRVRDEDGLEYALAFDQRGVTVPSPARPSRPHAYAVAELLVEGLSAFTVPAAWTRHACYRIHNLSPVDLTVTVEKPGGGTFVQVVPKHQCRAFRSDVVAGTVEAPHRYLWRFRNRSGRPRFWAGGGFAGIPESSIPANNLANPHGVLLGWAASLGWRHDPAVVKDDGARYAGLFGDCSVSTTKLGDLLHHRGAVWSVAWSGTTPVVTAGEFTGHDGLVADMAAIGVTVTESGGALTFSGTGLDLFAPTSNLMLVGGVGDGGYAAEGGARWYRPLPVTLPGPDLRLDWGAGIRIAPETRTVSRTWYDEGFVDDPDHAHTASASHTYDARALSGWTGRAWTLRETVGDVTDAVAEEKPADASLTMAWSLGPQGFEALLAYHRRLKHPGDFISGAADPWWEDIYSSMASDGTLGARWRLLLAGAVGAPSGWPVDVVSGSAVAPTSLYPRVPRLYGQVPYPGGGEPPDVRETADFGPRTLAADPVPAPKTITEEARLEMLQRAVASPDGLADSTRLPSYGLVPDDEGLAALRALSLEVGGAYANRSRFAAGLPPEWGAFEAVRFKMLPLDAAGFNHLAWCVNRWTRCRPAYVFADFFVGTDVDGYPFRLTDEHASRGWLETPMRPAKQYMASDSGTWPFTGITTARLAAAGIPVRTADDAPGWTAAKAAYDEATWNVWKFGIKRVHTENTILDPIDSGGALYYPVRRTFHHTPDGVVLDSTTAWGTPVDHDVFRAPMEWLSVDDLATWAAARGLPFRHRSSGPAYRLAVVATTTPSFLLGTDGPDITEVQGPFGPYGPDPSGIPELQMPADHTTYQSFGAPQKFIWFLPATTSGEADWIGSVAESPPFKEGWGDPSYCWRLDLRQADGYASSPWLPGEVGLLEGGVTRSRRFMEEQSMVSLRTSPAGVVDESRLLLVPVPAEEATVDWALPQGFGMEPGSSGFNTLVPWTVTAPVADHAKAVDFSSVKSFFRAGAHEAWRCRLWEQVYLDLR